MQGCEYLISAVDLVRTVVAAVDNNLILVRLHTEASGLGFRMPPCLLCVAVACAACCALGLPLWRTDPARLCSVVRILLAAL